MKVLNHELAYQALREALNDEISAESFICDEVAFERLRRALLDNELSSADRAVRLRHALRYADCALTSIGVKHSLKLPLSNAWPKPESLLDFGLRTRPGGSVEADPWLPSWLSGLPMDGVDASASMSSLRRWSHRSPCADPWITRNLGFGHYRGPGQALAVRSALHMPEESTLLILLPTGEGKSLVFQAIASENPGKTVVVVVPTVALALDHSSALQAFPGLHPEQPHAYIGGQDADNERIRIAIASGTQGLVFAAPEAVVTGLTKPLFDAAREGRLAALIIDEAHLVDAWGTAFRSEFQLLSAFANELRSISPQQHKAKIICLSATVTQGALETLESLFSPDQPISIVPSARLRPEPDIWIAPIALNEVEQQVRVLEALRNLPRPAVLYVTEVSKAELWKSLLIQKGFQRIGVVHGNTSTEDRKKVLDAWRCGELDLVVGTSAFGLGIDYPHVRTVIHACVPENLDRYYQEIGRSGRDNRSSIALLIPLHSDFTVAEGLSTKKVISIEKGHARWKAMFLTKIADEHVPGRFLVNPSASPGYDPDMKSERSEDWNARVLNLMARSGLIRLSGLRYDPETKVDLIAIDILDGGSGHHEFSTWQNIVEPMRQRILTLSREGYQAMWKLISDKACPSKLFDELYTLRHQGRDLAVISACGGCKACRKDNKNGWFANWPNAPESPWAIGHLDSRLLTFFYMGRCFVERLNESFEKTRSQRRLKEILDALWELGLRKFIVIGSPSKFLHDLLANKPWCVAFSKNDKIISSNGLPPGPEIIWVENGYMLKAHHLNSLPVGEERIFLLPQDFNDPANPDRILADRFPLISFDKFHDWLLI